MNLTPTGLSGIQVNTICDPDTNQIDIVSVGFDTETRNAIEFVKDFQRMAGIWQGYDFSTRFRELTDFMDKYHQDQRLDAELRLTNPAVAQAYEHYRTMLALAKEHPNG